MEAMTSTQVLDWSRRVPSHGPERKAFIDAHYQPRTDGWWDHVSPEAREVIDHLERELFAINADYGLQIARAIDREDYQYASRLEDEKRRSGELIFRQILRVDNMFIRPMMMPANFVFSAPPSPSPLPEPQP